MAQRAQSKHILPHPIGVALLLLIITTACLSIPVRPPKKPPVVATPAAATPTVDTATLSPSAVPTDPPTPVAVITQDATLRRLSPSVFSGSSFPLGEVQVDDPFELAAGGFVTTDINGEAEVTIQDCLKIFIFQDSSLQRKTCRKSDAASGLGVCSGGGLTGVLNNCLSQVAIQTPGSEVITNGTWFTVLYLPEDKLSIVQVYEGSVDVSSVIQETSGESTSGQELEAGNLWFTSPGADAPVIAGINGREAQPMEVWAALRPELITKYPLLDKWLNSARDTSRINQLPFPEFLARPQGEVNIYFVGPGWNKNSLENGMYIGIPWGQLSFQAWFDLAVTPRLYFNNTTVEDARRLDTRLDTAQKTLLDEGFNSKYIQITVLDTDFNSQIFADGLQNSLKNLGINSELILLSAADLKIAIANARDSDNPPFLWIDVSGEAFKNQ